MCRGGGITIFSNTLATVGTVFLATTISTPTLPPATDHLLQPSPSTPTPYLQRRKQKQKQKQAKNPPPPPLAGGGGGGEKSKGPSSLQPTTAYGSLCT